MVRARVIAAFSAALCLVLAPPVLAKTTVTLWTDAPQPSALGKMVAAIKAAHPDIELKAEAIAPEQYAAALARAAETDTLPDIIGLSAGFQVQRLRGHLSDAGRVADGQIGKEWQKHFIGLTLQLVRIGNPPHDDSFYLLPMTASLDGLWVNSSVLGRAGVSAPPANLDQLGQAAKKLRQAGITPLVLGETAERASVALFLSILAQTDKADLLKAEEGQAVWSRPGALQAAQAWHRLFADGVLDSQVFGMQPQQARKDFLAGKAAMIVMGSQFLSLAETARGGAAPLAGFTPMRFPAVRANGPASPWLAEINLGWGMAHNATGAPDVHGAVETVLHDLVAGPGAQAGIDALVGIPADKDLRPHVPLSPVARTLYYGAKAALGAAKPGVIGNPAVAQALAEHLRAMADGRETPAAAMQAVDAVAKRQAMLAG